ncbi:MAG: PASTA domain-containing protein [Gemmatimonadetes bacterium]|nr:PASTA domain-containing protein [Gemmatimonadota bacterium]
MVPAPGDGGRRLSSRLPVHRLRGAPGRHRAGRHHHSRRGRAHAGRRPTPPHRSRPQGFVRRIPLFGRRPKSTVLAQNPPAGSVVAPGTTISLDVSAGQQRATIPALVGLASEDAERELKKAGLQLGQLQEQPSDSARGLVLGSNPSDGQVVPLGTRVDLIVSAGPAQLTMPDVVGQDYESAAALLAQLGLVTAPPDYDPDSTLPRGAVVSQSPAAGASVAAGTTITLRVAGTP